MDQPLLTSLTDVHSDLTQHLGKIADDDMSVQVSNDTIPIDTNLFQEIDFTDAKWPEQQSNSDKNTFYNDIRAHLDTGAKVTVAILCYILHNYQQCSSNFQCPVRSFGAMSTGDSIYLENDGYCHISGETLGCIIKVEYYYSPNLTLTHLGKSNIVYHTTNPLRYTGQTLEILYSTNDRLLYQELQNGKFEKYPNRSYNYDEGTFIFTCHHCSNICKQIIM